MSTRVAAAATVHIFRLPRLQERPILNLKREQEEEEKANFRLLTQLTGLPDANIEDMITLG
jgi:hypothetical protein